MNTTQIMDMVQRQAQSLFIGQSFGEIMERLDWIGRKLDGEEMETSYNDIKIKQLQNRKEQLEQQLQNIKYQPFSELQKCCCEAEIKTKS